MLKKYVWCGLVVLITGTAFALGTGGEENLRRKAKAGDAEAQYLLAMQLEMTTDPVNLNESEFYYWLKKLQKTANVIQFSETFDGIKFRSYFDVNTGRITNIHPE